MRRQICALRCPDNTVERVVLVKHLGNGQTLVEKEHGLDLETVPTAALTLTDELEDCGRWTYRKQKRKARLLRDRAVDEFEYDPDRGFINFW